MKNISVPSPNANQSSDYNFIQLYTFRYVNGSMNVCINICIVILKYLYCVGRLVEKQNRVGLIEILTFIPVTPL